MIAHPRILLFIVLNLVTVIAVAATPVATTITTPANPTSIVDYCPEPQTLVKEQLIWSAPEGWVSYSESFDKQIVSFIRAEWVGINVGKIICLYRGELRNSFPIALEQKQNKLVPLPSGSQWGKEQNSRKECIANTVKDCPFRFEKQDANKNIYEELDFFKGKKDYNNN